MGQLIREPKKSKSLTYSQTSRVIIIFLAIALGVLYQRHCHLKNNLNALRETVALVQVEVNLEAVISEALVTKTKFGFDAVGKVLKNHSGGLLEMTAALDAQKEFSEELVESLEEVYGNTTLSFPKVIEEALPGVVGIVWHESEPTQPCGTGAVINCWEGHILTAKHVVVDRYGFSDPNEYYVVLNGERVPIKEIFPDPNEDLAILVLDMEDPNYRPSMEIALASPNDMVWGQLVISLGHPFGEPLSAGAGIISNPDGTVVRNGDTYSRVQYDAAANPGNSGGPVLNLAGEIVGICVSGHDGGCPGGADAGVNFAVPVSEILKSLVRFEAWKASDLVIEEEDVEGLPLSIIIQIMENYNE